MGADIVNCSWGGSGSSSSLQSAIEASSALFVCAAGNSSSNNDSVPHTPSGLQSANILAVAATNDNDVLASFSNYGELSVDVGAPGDDINSTWPGREALFYDGFDDGNISDWMSSGGTWATTTSISNSPDYSLTDSPSGNYSNNTNKWIRPVAAVNLSGKTGCTLEYHMKLRLETGYDLLCVEASTNPTGGYTTLGGAHSEIGEDCWTGSTTGSGLHSFLDSLTDFDGNSSVYIRFRLDTDFSITDDGVYLDDVTVTCSSDTYDGTEYRQDSGTSMAAPHAAGVAALVLANTPSLTSLEVKHILINTVDPLPSLAGKSVSGGRVNAYAALNADLGFLPPVAPSSLRAHVTSTTSLSLSWHDNSAFEDEYHIERKDGPFGTFTVLDTVIANTTSYHDDGLTKGLRYTYRIRGLNTNGFSPYSNEASAIPDSGSSGDSNSFFPGCFIATAAYGTPMAGEVETLRRFRDEHLMKNPMGRVFVSLYYTWSPPAARVISRHPALRAAARTALTPVVYSVKHPVRGGLITIMLITAAVYTAARIKRRKKCDS